MTWTAERRRQQSEAIRQWQPWQHSTGPRSGEGKTKVARNAYKGGEWKALREIAALVAGYREDLKRHNEARHTGHSPFNDPVCENNPMNEAKHGLSG